MRATQAGVLGLVLLLAVAAGKGDPGLLLELDRTHFELAARDLAGEQSGPRLRVVIGSPAHPTPSGVFALHRVVLNPAWHPGRHARSAGARARPPSPSGPLGVAKIPFAEGGAIALHGGAKPLLLGKPVSLGCVRAADADLLELVDWLDARGALGPRQKTPGGELRRPFRRPTRLVVR